MSKKFTIQDVIELKKLLDKNPIPKSKPICVRTDDNEIYTSGKDYTDIKFFKLDGTPWK